MTTGLVLDTRFTEHKTGAGHPERPERIVALKAAFEAAKLVERTAPIEPSAVSEKLMAAVHTPEYLERLAHACRNGAPFIDCADSAICDRSFEIARLAAGGVIEAIDQVMAGTVRNAFCAVRPPGHHAEKDHSMGFCLLNNIALGAQHLLDHHKLSRVLVLDWDVHHGNGTQHIFESSPKVFFASIHGDPTNFYPRTGFATERGKGAGLGTTLNIPLSPGTTDEQYLKIFDEQFLPAAREYRPEFVLISSGFDAHVNDPLGEQRLSSEAFYLLTRRMVDFAEARCGGRLVSVLEGGYNLTALSDAATRHVAALME